MIGGAGIISRKLHSRRLHKLDKRSTWSGQSANKWTTVGVSTREGKMCLFISADVRVRMRESTVMQEKSLFVWPMSGGSGAATGLAPELP